MSGVVKYPLGLPGLDDLAAAHDEHPVGDAAHHAEIVRDKQVGQPVLPRQIRDQVENLRPHPHVEGGDRLVEDHQLGPDDQGAGDGDALTLPAREFVDMPVGVIGVQPDLGQGRADAVAPVGRTVGQVERFGHQAGDNILQSVADALSTHLRDYDTLARYGGEEFVVLLPNTGKTKAAEVADRLRAEVEKLPVSFRKEPVTISLGVATFPGDAGNLRELIRQADNALYGSKRAGRNRVTLAGAPNPGPPPASSSAG